jgi:CBS domain-containing protein
MTTDGNLGDFVMRTSKALTGLVIPTLLSTSAFAEDVTLPAPVLEWSVYILLIFAACVAVGIAVFKKGKNGEDDTVGSLLFEQNSMIHSVDPDVSIMECVSRMNELRIGAMLVMENERLLGIFTERDALTRVLGAGLDPANTNISEVMTKNPIHVSTNTNLDEVRSIISSRRIRHLPIVEGDKVLGLVSSGDLAHRLIED